MLVAKTIDCMSETPKGWTWGDFLVGPGWNARYLVRECDGAFVIVRSDPLTEPITARSELELLVALDNCD